MIKKLVLDACCGGRMMWFDKKNPCALFADIRSRNFVLSDGRKFRVRPDLKMDFTKMPFHDGAFKLVVFDPPHLKNAGKTGWQAKKYGSLSEGWHEDLRKGFSECFRVLEENGLLIFKWNSHSIKTSEVLKLAQRPPLFGHTTGQNGKTIWVTFLKHSPVETAAEEKKS